MNQTPSQQRYAEHLASDYWQQVSAAVKDRAGHRCQVCNSPHDLQAHHRTYTNRGREMEHLNDLICLCRRCHGVFHGRLRESTHRATDGILVMIDEFNCGRLKQTKEVWHWLKAEQLKPRKTGWARRAIGREVPASFLR